MKPMLKTAFFSLVKRLMREGCNPTINKYYAHQPVNLVWIDSEGKTQVEPIYQTSIGAKNTVTARFDAWFAAAVAEFHAEAAECMDLNDKVIHGDAVHTVTGFRNEIARSSNGTPRKYKRTGVVILDGSIEANAGDLKPVVFNDVPADQLIETQWTDMTITLTVSNDRMQSAIGKGVITSAFQAYSIAFDWKIEFGGEGYPATLSFVGEPSITSPLCHCRCDDLLLVLETVDEKLGLLDVIHDKLATWTRYPLTERLKTSGA